jgi:hypothetical protein
MPSVDRAGRHFPLTMALVADATVLQSCAGWLAGAERAGLAALEHDLAPESLAAEVTAALERPTEPGLPELAPLANGLALWWTAGAPRVPATTLLLAELPDATGFAAMLHAGADATHDPAMNEGA